MWGRAAGTAAAAWVGATPPGPSVPAHGPGGVTPDKRPSQRQSEEGASPGQPLDFSATALILDSTEVSVPPRASCDCSRRRTGWRNPDLRRAAL